MVCKVSSPFSSVVRDEDGSGFGAFDVPPSAELPALHGVKVIAKSI
jgi:hypothetical protein